MSKNGAENLSSSQRLAVILASFQNDPTPALRGLVDNNPKVRSTSLRALEKLALLDDDQLSTALGDLDPQVRRTACEIASKHTMVDLNVTLRDSDPFVVEIALWSIGERQDPAYVQIICNLASSHGESLVREAAIAALGSIGDEDGLDTIMLAMKDRSNVRRRAVVALAAFEGDAVNDALENATRDRDWQVRQIAEDLLDISNETGD